MKAYSEKEFEQTLEWDEGARYGGKALQAEATTNAKALGRRMPKWETAQPQATVYRMEGARERATRNEVGKMTQTWRACRLFTLQEKENSLECYNRVDTWSDS